MKLLSILAICVFLVSCQKEDVEKFAFEKTLEYDVAKKCGDDEACVEAVKKLTPKCIEVADWKSLMKNKNDDKEKVRFMTAYYACITDKNGKPYFHIK